MLFLYEIIKRKKLFCLYIVYIARKKYYLINELLYIEYYAKISRNGLYRCKSKYIILI